MKLATVLVAIMAIQYVFTAQGTPAAASYCMGNNDNATTCSSCFNWGAGGTIGARQLAANACTTAVANSVTDCKIYNGLITSTKSMADCMMCKSKDWLNVTNHATPASIAITCSNTSISTTTCATKVANCEQSVCFKHTDNTYSVLCGMCSSGYMGSGTRNANLPLYPTCSTNTITNADVGNPGDNAKVYTCKSGHAVANAHTSCVAFTTDSNCRELGTGDTYCGQCWHSYYFDTTTCKMGASLMSFAGIVMAALYLM